MSKTLSLDTKHLYQIGIIAIIVASLVLSILVIIQSFKLFNQPEIEPTINIREQQLNNAINLTFPKN